MKKFDIPIYYRSPVISIVKESRKITDPRKKDYSPSILDFGPVVFLIARHFGFCYGVENAIEIAYRAVEDNKDKRIFLLSEMIHNPKVNEDLRKKGVRFIKGHDGKQLVEWEELRAGDIVIVPAFGTTLEIQEKLAEAGINPYKYDTTCPFVEKVWNKAEQIGGKGYSIVVHGKYDHEETIATFSHSRRNSPTVIVRDIEETKVLAGIITGKTDSAYFYEFFRNKFSRGFDVKKDLERIGVVNQTTMLATETQAIAGLLKDAMEQRYGKENIGAHLADTSDTLCYATYDNQRATLGLIGSKADFAVVVGGYNSSNTSHIVELCEEKLPVYFISGPGKIVSEKEILHFDIKSRKEVSTEGWLLRKESPVRVILTSGASCPDVLLDEVLQKIVSYFPDSRSLSDVLEPFMTEDPGTSL